MIVVLNIEIMGISKFKVDTANVISFSSKGVHKPASLSKPNKTLRPLH